MLDEIGDRRRLLDESNKRNQYIGSGQSSTDEGDDERAVGG